MDRDRIIEEAREAQKKGTGRFCLITSGRKLNDKEFETILSALAEYEKRQPWTSIALWER